VRRALHIFAKDMREYYLKAPVISWGLLFPVTAVVLMSLGLAAYGENRLVPGMIVLSLLFAATSMAQVAVAFEKRSGSFQLLLFMPVPPHELLLGKSLGGITYGFIGVGVAGLIIYATTGHTMLLHPGFFAAAVLLGSLTFTLLALAITLPLEPVSGVAVLNIARFTMVFLGGIVFPKVVFPRQLLPLAYTTPSTYVVEMIRYSMYNTWDYVDPYTSLIMSLIMFVTVALVTARITDKVLYP
jgi:ABC-2 type transport system permease protein